MKESVAIAKDIKKSSLPTCSSEEGAHRLRNTYERQLGSLGDVIGNIGRDGTALSAESIATELGGRSATERTPALLALQKTHGNWYVQRVVSGIQAKLKVGPPGDIYEQEADRVADAVMRMVEPAVQRQVEPEGEEENTLQSKPLANQITPSVQVQRQEEPEEEEETLHAKPLAEEITPFVQMQVEPEEEEEELQAKATSGHPSEVDSNLESQIQYLKGGGQPLPENDRAFFEPRFGRDFSQVRVHTDATVDRLAKEIGAKAFTTGRDIFFREGAYEPRSETGMKLMSHELTHVVQQRMPFRHKGFDLGTIQLSPEVEPTVEPKLSPKKVEIAVKRNKRFSKKLGWEKKFDLFKTLESMPPSTVNKLRDLWVGKEYRKFAQLVARFQFYILRFKGRDIDGVIGPRTWDRVRPIGEVVAKQKVKWEDSKNICYEASRERLVKGYQRATGKKLVPKEKRGKVKIILKSTPSELNAAGIEKKYWGTSASGALVWLGKGEFVSESHIWNNKALKPGAVIQVWDKKSDLDRIRKGKNPLSWGTSAVFLEYVKKDSVKVLHFSGVETWKRGKFQVWIGANLLAR